MGILLFLVVFASNELTPIVRCGEADVACESQVYDAAEDGARAGGAPEQTPNHSKQAEADEACQAQAAVGRLRAWLLTRGIGLPAAQNCETHEIGFPGPHAVRTFVTKFRDCYGMTVFYPETAPLTERLPVVIFSTGWNLPRNSYYSYGELLAQWGYVAIIHSHPSYGLFGIGNAMGEEQVQQVRALIDWCEQESDRPESPFYGRIDLDRVGVVGHSLGGAVSIGAAVLDSRIKAVVAFDCTHEGGEVSLLPWLSDCTAAILYVRAGDGAWCTTPPWADQLLFERTNPPTAEVAIEGAGHMAYPDMPAAANRMLALVCPRGDRDRQEVRDTAGRYMIAWLNYHLRGQAEFASYFNGPEAGRDIEDGLVTIRLNLGEGAPP